MSAKLNPEQKLKREIRVYGLVAPVIITLTSEFITFKVKGSKTGITAPWSAVVAACSTPDNVPSKLHGQPLAFLQDTTRRINESLIKRLNKEAKAKEKAQ